MTCPAREICAVTSPRRPPTSASSRCRFRRRGSPLEALVDEGRTPYPVPRGRCRLTLRGGPLLSLETLRFFLDLVPAFSNDRKLRLMDLPPCQKDGLLRRYAAAASPLSLLSCSSAPGIAMLSCPCCSPEAVRHGPLRPTTALEGFALLRRPGCRPARINVCPLRTASPSDTRMFLTIPPSRC